MTWVLGRDHYSQVPYALGDNQGRHEVPPQAEDTLPNLNEALGATPRAEAAAHVAATLATSAVSFDLLLQIKPVDGTQWERFYADSTLPWSEECVTVGSVDFPKQTLVEHSNKALKQAMALSDEDFQALHKSFKFHPVSTAEEHRPVGQI